MELRVDALEDIFPLADFIADALGEMVEVVVQDTADTECSLVYSRNSSLSGRKLGDGMTDYALRLVREEAHADKPYVANYPGKSAKGNSFRSSTFFVRNRNGDLIGLLCINVCTTGVTEALRVLGSFLSGRVDAGGSATHVAPGIEETLQGDPKQTIRSIARKTIRASLMNPDWMTRTERLAVLRKISDEGVFLMKGAVPIVADEFGVSVPTLYKYLQEIKED